MAKMSASPLWRSRIPPPSFAIQSMADCKVNTSMPDGGVGAHKGSCSAQDAIVNVLARMLSGGAIRLRYCACDATSGRFCHQFALALPHERLEGFGLRAAELFDRIGHRETGPLRIEAGSAERFPERGQMFERVRVEASRKRFAAPLVVR